VIFFRVSIFYRQDAPTAIEFSLEEIAPPPQRVIPRPRPRREVRSSSVHAERPEVSARPVPDLKPIDVNPKEILLPESLREKSGAQDLSVISAPEIAEWRPEEKLAVAEPYETAESYFEMIKRRIEQQKTFPEAAKFRRIEGRVGIRFVLTSNGEILSVIVRKKSGSLLLDDAALDAVRKAAPFPQPPPELFQGGLLLDLEMVFELN
jgi:periplasmic protein TonB